MALIETMFYAQHRSHNVSIIVGLSVNVCFHVQCVNLMC